MVCAHISAPLQYQRVYLLTAKSYVTDSDAERANASLSIARMPRMARKLDTVRLN